MDYTFLISNFLMEHADAPWGRQRLLYECLRSAILVGTLKEGTRLLSSRELSRELGIARNSVIYAYEQLVAEGFVQSSHRGTFVASVLTKSRIDLHKKIKNHCLSKRTQGFGVACEGGDIQSAFVVGVPCLEAFPIGQWRRLLDQEWRKLSSQQLSYRDAIGELDLRVAIANYLRASRGLRCDADQVFITDGTQSSLDLCARLFADVGDIVWIENPGYVGARTAFSVAGLRLIPIDVDDDGMCPKAEDWRRHPPKLIYLTPSHQYPLGSVLSLERRLSIIEHANAIGALIIEDDYDSEFRRDGPPLPAMQGLSQDSPVIYLGTFSKSMFPALRLGFMVVPAALAPLVNKALTTLVNHGRPAEQLALAKFIENGLYTSHLRRMRRLYAERRDALQAALVRHLGTAISIYGGSSGIHLSIELADGGSDVLISQAVLRQGIIARPLSEHVLAHARRRNWSGFLLGFASVAASDVDEAVRKLAGAIRKHR
ncbi:MAG: PLP-dependent aminotransferase family protein [Pseudomonadota bacterium]